MRRRYFEAGPIRREGLSRRGLSEQGGGARGAELGGEGRVFLSGAYQNRAEVFRGGTRRRRAGSCVEGRVGGACLGGAYQSKAWSVEAGLVERGGVLWRRGC